MNEFFMWPAPIIYLLIVGFERLFWRARYKRIKSSIRPNFIVLTAVTVLLNVIIWLTQHVKICWQ